MCFFNSHDVLEYHVLVPFDGIIYNFTTGCDGSENNGFLHY